jgi:hypothetical protein
MRKAGRPDGNSTLDLPPRPCLKKQNGDGNEPDKGLKEIPGPPRAVKCRDVDDDGGGQEEYRNGKNQGEVDGLSGVP